MVAVIASNLAARMRGQAVTARQRAKTTEDLYLFARKLAGIGRRWTICYGRPPSRSPRC